MKILSGGVPKIYDISELDGKTWLLMEFIPGGDLRKCTRAKLTLVLDALIAMQERFWNDRSFERCGYSYEKSLAGRKKRGEYLEDLELEAAYGKFLEQYSAVPRTLCHDDLLPFNVLVSAERAVFIDWEYAGILPYPAAFARLIAHGEEGEDAFFHMRQADRAFAISYYYESLLKGKGISRADWQKTLDYFLLYEYCEWVMIGNRYGDTSGGRYRKYLALAKEMAKKLL